ncbi:Cilia- and flagella-associated protein 91 [Amphibalanus amphitrite]|uniref:Cilia- and flagella-associated protein 91 n=1 Tax=Amphibalanus amphitrite TaxID=1232801 RepID=A0A6A4XA70_AMPAM|nr:Cilia- and flagella-associated protein 91 [Amphibalanus amphitrite]
MIRCMLYPVRRNRRKKHTMQLFRYPDCNVCRTSSACLAPCRTTKAIRGSWFARRSPHRSRTIGSHNSNRRIMIQRSRAKNRFKYFNVMLPAYQHAVLPAGLHLAAAGAGDSAAQVAAARQVSAAAEAAAAAVSPPAAAVRSRGTQTDYRESEAQTEPYSPPYRVVDGDWAEELTVAALSWGHGLPAGQAEVEMIERLRNRRCWGETLPPTGDRCYGERRIKLIESIERQEWVVREAEISQIQASAAGCKSAQDDWGLALRLELMKHLLKEQEDRRKQRVTRRLDKRWKIRVAERDTQILRIQSQYARDTRRLRRWKEHKLGQASGQQRDIIAEYDTPGSTAFAPLTRQGADIDHLRGQPRRLQLPYLETRRGVETLEEVYGEQLTSPVIRMPDLPVSHLIEQRYSRKHLLQKELLDVHKMIKAEQELAAAGTEPSSPRFLEKIEHPPPRPVTPTVAAPDAQDCDRSQAAICLQRILRGRAVQIRMERGVERRYDLIQELRGTHALQNTAMEEKGRDQRRTLCMQRMRDDQYVDEALSRIEGATVARLLDQLSNELIRLQEERRIHAFVLMAERERQRREAAEAGLRQRQLRRRREMDEIFKRTMKVHQQSVDTYLEDVILESTERTADQQARQHVRELAAHLNDIVHDLEQHPRDEWQSEELVSELVHSFVLPEVQRKETRARLRRHQQRHLAAARDTVLAELGGTGWPPVDASTAERARLAAQAADSGRRDAQVQAGRSQPADAE